jgi:hypothetical protein
MRTIVTIYQSRYANEISSERGYDGVRQRLAALHIRFYIALFVAVFLAVYSRNYPVIAVFIFYSYWVPQVVWNVTSGTRKPFNPAYYIGKIDDYGDDGFGDDGDRYSSNDDDGGDDDDCNNCERNDDDDELLIFSIRSCSYATLNDIILS